MIHATINVDMVPEYSNIDVKTVHGLVPLTSEAWNWSVFVCYGVASAYASHHKMRIPLEKNGEWHSNINTEEVVYIIILNSYIQCLL
jgi:hypothetical protein